MKVELSRKEYDVNNKTSKETKIEVSSIYHQRTSKILNNQDGEPLYSNFKFIFSIKENIKPTDKIKIDKKEYDILSFTKTRDFNEVERYIEVII